MEEHWSSGFEFVDIEIIDHKNENKQTPQKWYCDQCSLFYLSYDKLMEHKIKKHSTGSDVKCRYCNKILSTTEESKECYSNKKCETCEYRCSQCPQRFLRHSSLVNHENNHSKPKQRKSGTPKSVNKRPIQNTSLSESSRKTKRTSLKADKEFLNNTVESNVPTKSKRKQSTTPRKRQNLQTDVPVIESNFSSEDVEINNTRKPKRSFNTLVEKKANSGLTKKNKDKTPGIQIEKASSSVTLDSTSSSEAKSVNYKPFSCHICNDNFASEGVLLVHIQTHGDAAKSFKCKFCTEQFDTIYDIQYHLAICPLAEDELETTLKNTVPPKFLTLSPKPLKKRGRPRKSLPSSLEDTSNSVHTPSPSIGTRNKRKSVTKTPEPLHKVQKVTFNPLPNGNVELPLPINETDVKDEIDLESDGAANDLIDDLSPDFNNDQLDESFESGTEDSKKHNVCPFPRCGMKFTREKALECHMRNHNDDFDDTLKCHKCDIPFDDIKSLRSHVDECQVYNEEVDDDDDFDGPKKFKTERLNISTTRVKKSGGNFQCKTCGRKYVSMDKLKRHMAQHGSSNFMCRICKDVFISQAFLDQHFVDAHHTKSTHHCDICEEDFISELFLQIHNTEYHNSSTIHTKQDSTTSSTEGQDTSSKVVTRKGFSKRNFNKNKCVHTANKESYKGVNNSGYLKEKVTLSKTNDSPFWCPVCLERFDERKKLRSHLLSNHAVCYNSKYMCEICDIEKPSAETLCWHLEVHSNNKLSVNRFSKLRIHVTSTMKEAAESAPKPRISYENEKKSEKSEPRISPVGVEDGSTQVIEVNSVEVPSTFSSRSKLSQFNQETELKANVKSKLQSRGKSLCLIKSHVQICSSNSLQSKEDEIKSSTTDSSKVISKLMTTKLRVSGQVKPPRKSNRRFTKHPNRKYKNYTIDQAKKVIDETISISYENSRNDYNKVCKRSKDSDIVAGTIPVIEPCRNEVLIDNPPNKMATVVETSNNQEDRLKNTRSRSKVSLQVPKPEKSHSLKVASVENSDVSRNPEINKLPEKSHVKKSENISCLTNTTLVLPETKPTGVNILSRNKRRRNVSKFFTTKRKRGYIINTRKSKQKLLNYQNSINLNKVEIVLHDISKDDANHKNPVTSKIKMGEASVKDPSLASNEKLVDKVNFEDTSLGDSLSEDNKVDRQNTNQACVSNNQDSKMPQPDVIESNKSQIDSKMPQPDVIESNKSQIDSKPMLRSFPKMICNSTKSEILSHSETSSSDNFRISSDSGNVVFYGNSSKVLCEELVKEKDLEKLNETTMSGSSQGMTGEPTILDKEENSRSANSAFNSANLVNSAEEKDDTTVDESSSKNYNITKSKCDESTEGSSIMEQTPVDKEENSELFSTKIIDFIGPTDSKVDEGYSVDTNVECVNGSLIRNSKCSENILDTEKNSELFSTKLTDFIGPTDSKVDESYSVDKNVECVNGSPVAKSKCSRNTKISESLTTREDCLEPVINSIENIKETNLDGTFCSADKVEFKSDSSPTRRKYNESLNSPVVTGKMLLVNKEHKPSKPKDFKANLSEDQEYTKTYKSTSISSSEENVECKSDSPATKDDCGENIEGSCSPTSRDEILPGDTKQNSPKPANISNLTEDQQDLKSTDSSSSVESAECNTSFAETGRKLDKCPDDSKSPSPSDDVFEEVPCDKCPLKFNNQDDLFDHIATHYDF